MSTTIEVDSFKQQDEQRQLRLEYPRLRHCTFVKDRDDDDRMTMIVGQNHYEIGRQAGSIEKFLEIKSYFDGRYHIREISERTGASYEDIKEIVESFLDLELMRHEEPLDLIPSADFITRVRDSSIMWKRQIGYHRLHGMLRTGEAPRRVFVGLIQEVYHYIRSAQKHISVALAHCTNREWQVLLTDYFNAECNHYELALQTLENLGVPRDRAIGAHPIIGTMSLINMFCEIGRSSTLAYFACTSLFEAREEDYESAKDSFEGLAMRYGFGAEAVKPLIEHMRADIGAGHRSLLAEALKDFKHVEAGEAHYAVNCMHDLKHSFDQFNDQVIQYYSDISNYVPRLKVDYFSL